MTPRPASRAAHGILIWQVRDRGWAALLHLTSYPDRRRGKLDYAVVRAPKDLHEEALARALDEARWRTHTVTLPQPFGGKIGFDPSALPKLVARALSAPLSQHELARLTLECLAVDVTPVTFETEVRGVRAAETADALEQAYIVLLSALTRSGSTCPAEDARIRFGLCYATEMRKRQDWRADRESRA